MTENMPIYYEVAYDHLEALRAAIRSLKLRLEAGAGAGASVGVPEAGAGT